MFYAECDVWGMFHFMLIMGVIVVIAEALPNPFNHRR